MLEAIGGEKYMVKSRKKKYPFKRIVDCKLGRLGTEGF
jgi:hypothetical protein